MLDETQARTEGHTPVANRSTRKSFLGAGLAVLLSACAFFSGLQIGQGQITDTHLQAGLFSFFNHEKAIQPQDADLTQFWKVWHLLDEKFVSSTSTTVSTQEKLEGAIAGLVASYKDPYTIFLPPEEAGMFEEDISGNFGGVGMEVGLRDGLVTVISPLPNTPAAKAGILAKDVLIKIDDASTEGMTIDEAVRKIRGEKGSTVKFTIFREGATELLTVSVVRDNIEIPTVETKEEKDVFIILLYSFNAKSESKMAEALNAYARSGKSKLVLDVRGNPGGYLESAVSIASYFLPAGLPVVRERFREGDTEEVHRSSGRSLGKAMPKEMVVLVDGGSASASEILAGALKEHGVATLMGAQTYGKGSVQELIDLRDGSSLKVTIARWFTPNGVSISEAGLAPNIFVERSVEQVQKGEDPQLAAALAYLAGEKNVGTTTPPKKTP